MNLLMDWMCFRIASGLSQEEIQNLMNAVSETAGV